MATKSAFRSGNSKGKKLDQMQRRKSLKIPIASTKVDESQFSKTVKDMKSLLPGYDEASSFAHDQGRQVEIGSIGTGTIPKAGRSVPKLNIEDLPMQFGNRDIMAPGKQRVKSRQKILDDYDLMSKFDSTVYHPDVKLTQAVASKLKSNPKRKPAPHDPLPQAVIQNVRAEYMKLKTNVTSGIEQDLGFGFRPSDLNNQKKLKATDDALIAMQNAAKRTEISVKSLKKKIDNKKEEWKREKVVRGNHYKEAEVPGILKLPGSNAPSKPPNENLAEIANRFRKSLSINIDMKRAIRTPRSAGADGKTAKAKGIEQSSSFDSMVHTNTSTSMDEEHSNDPDSGRSSLLTRSNALYYPVQTPSGPEKSGTDGQKNRKAQSKQSSQHSNSQSFIDLSGIIPLNSLLDEHNSASSRQTQKATKAHPAKSEAVTQYEHPSETKILSEHYYIPSAKIPPKKEASASVPVEDFLKQRLGESVKTVDDAAKIATRLGSLMARVAMSKNSKASDCNLDAVSLARELRELATSMEKNYGVNGMSSQNSGATATQTEQELKLIPQPKFTKQMSYTDQLVLRKLRSIRQEWNSAGGATGIESQSADDI